MPKIRFLFNFFFLKHSVSGGLNMLKNETVKMLANSFLCF